MKCATEVLIRRPEGCLSDLEAEMFLCGDSPPGQVQRVETHLAACSRCAAMIDSMRTVTWRPDPESLRSRIAPESPVSRMARWLGRPAALVPTAGVLLVLAAAPFLLRNTEPPASVREKGGVSMRVFVKTPDGSRQCAQGEALREGDTIKFAVNPGRHNRVMLVNVEESGRISRYHPREGGSASVEPGKETLLPASIALDGYRGRERVFAIFSDSDQRFDEVETAVTREKRPDGRIDLLRVEKLGLPRPQASFLIRKE